MNIDNKTLIKTLQNKQSYINKRIQSFTKKYQIESDDLKQIAQLAVIEYLNQYPDQINNNTSLDNKITYKLNQYVKKHQTISHCETATNPFRLNQISIIDYHRMDDNIIESELKATMDKYAEQTKLYSHFNLVVNHLGMFEHSEHTYKQLAKTFKLSVTRIREKHNLALRELRLAETKTNHYLKYLLQTKAQMPDRY